MRRVFIALVLSVVLLSSCGTFEVYLDTTPVGESIIPGSEATSEPKLSLGSTSEQIQRAMLESATKWKSIWMDGTVTYHAMPQTDSQTTVRREQVWIDLTTNRFRVVMGPVEGAADQFLTSDGLTILKMDLVTGSSESYPMPDVANAGQFVPELQPGSAFPQPLWGQMGTPLSQLAFASDFAQMDGTFKPVGTETIAGRETLVVEWTQAQAELPSMRMWLDDRTAVILKMQTFDRDAVDTIRSEAVVNRISFDDVFANSLFGIPSSLPQFGGINGQPDEPAELGADVPLGRDVLGELYFFVSSPQAASSRQIPLVRLPGLCVVGKAECPQLEYVGIPFPISVGLPTLSWSPDGNFAAMPYPDSEEGTPFKLWLFDPAEDTWTSLWEHDYIDPPMWSADGKWIAFRQQDGRGGEDIIVIRSDGSDAKNLTSLAELPAEGRPYVMSGWVKDSIILHSANFGADGTVYLVRAPDGQVQPMFEKTRTKSVYFPSPDGMWIAYDDFDNAESKHTLTVVGPDGANAAGLADFAGGSLYPIVWSPNSEQLAFTYYTETSPGSQVAYVYVVGRDGKGLKQVYQGTTVSSVIFSPDGGYILISESSSATGARLFVVNLDTLEQRLLQSPGLSLDTDWYMPTWRK